MKELVEVMAKSLVSNPSAVVVEEETTGTSTVLRLHVAPEDMGKVIGCLLYTSPSPRDA
mgnify:CR=1 FL=1